MPQTTLYARSGEAIGTVELSDELFAAPVNDAVLHQAVTAQLAGRHLGTHDTKTRGEVRGGGKKPYRQKGTGRARQGSRTAPHYAGGGVVFGPHPRSLRAAPAPRDEAARPARRADRQARRRTRSRSSTRSPSRQIRTKDLVGVLGNLQAQRPGADRGSRPATRGSTSRRATCPRVEVLLADSLNIVDLLKADTVVIEQPALARLEEVYA